MTFTKLCAAIALAIPASFASAAVVDVSHTVDLTSAISGTSLTAYSNVAPFALAVGDTLSLNLDFLGKQTLKATNASYLYGWVFSYDGACTTFGATGSVSFINASGPVQSGSRTDSSACVHFGNAFYGADFTTGPGTIEFSGLNFATTVDSYDTGLSRTYDGVWFMMGAEALAIGSEVPEPASLALLALGAAGLFASRKRKQA